MNSYMTIVSDYSAGPACDQGSPLMHPFGFDNEKQLAGFENVDCRLVKSIKYVLHKSTN